MSSKREIQLAQQPALVPLFGGLDKKPRLLNQDVNTIGRARGCDIGLDAPEISALHCILYHAHDGFRIRDCGSRTGIRVNGEHPKAQALAEGDVLQIGPFSFSLVNAPGMRAGPSKLDNEEHIMNLKEQWASEQTETNAFLEKQRSALGQAEAALREQRTELGRMMNDLRELQASIKKQQGVDVPALVHENEELRGLLVEYETRLAGGQANPDSTKEAEALRDENKLLRELLDERDRAIDELKGQAEQLKAQQEAKPAKPLENADLESFEAELNQYRQKLETDRAELNEEIEQLQLRNAELDQATREMEMAMSKERAELARERMRLDRLRDDVRLELERAQRDSSVRESLAPVSKLREEITQKKSNGKDDGNRLGDRLSSFRSRLTDTPT